MKVSSMSWGQHQKDLSSGQPDRKAQEPGSVSPATTILPEEEGAIRRLPPVQNNTQNNTQSLIHLCCVGGYSARKLALMFGALSQG